MKHGQSAILSHETHRPVRFSEKMLRSICVLLSKLVCAQLGPERERSDDDYSLQNASNSFGQKRKAGEKRM